MFVFVGNVILKHPENDGESSKIQKINFQPTKSGGSKSNKYALQFFKESNEEIARRKEIARKTLEPKLEKELEINADEFYEKTLNFPKRPPWDFSLSKEELEAQEQRYFTVSTVGFLLLTELIKYIFSFGDDGIIF